MTISDLDVALRSVSTCPIIRAEFVSGSWLVAVRDDDDPRLFGQGVDELLDTAMAMAIAGFRARIAVRTAQEWDSDPALASMGG